MTRFLNLFSHGLLTRFAFIVISVNDLLTSMTEMSELRFLHHFPSLSIPLVKQKRALYPPPPPKKKKRKNKKKVFLLFQIKRGNFYHCSQFKRLLSYFSSLCNLVKHSMLDPYAKEHYRDMVNAGFLDNKVLQIL